MTPTMAKKPACELSPGTRVFMPQIEAMSVSGHR